MLQGKIIFQIVIDNAIDIITNSSSELFVFSHENKTVLMEVLDSLYPDWRNEYEEPRHISELSVEELNTYFSYKYREPYVKYETEDEYWKNAFSSRKVNKEEYYVPQGFTFDEIWDVDDDKWSSGYKLKNNVINPTSTWDSDFVTKENKDTILQKLYVDDLMKKAFFMFSFDENPDWEFQEKFMTIGDRLHLG